MFQESHNWRGGFCIEVSPVPNTIVIFGASGDLTKRKLIPALFSLYLRNLFHENSNIIGCARTAMDDDAFRNEMETALISQFGEDCREKLRLFLGKLHYLAGAYDSPETYSKLSSRLDEIEGGSAGQMPRIFYLSTPVGLYEMIVTSLGQSGLVDENYDGDPWRHVVIEKPFGHNLESSRKLEQILRSILKERQIYRIDHYLGKETVQNILMMRFANIIFEPIWNNRYIDNIQITVAESLGVGHRAGYYDSAGLLRDMFQNHMLEMLSLVAMEPPPSFEPHCVRDEKEKLLRSIRPFPINKLNDYIIRGQYQQGEEKELIGYRDEHNVPADSMTETFVSAKFLIDNWRWSGVPFYLRSGKRLPRKVSEIAITFKNVSHSIFNPIKSEDLSPNVLVLNVQPKEGLALTIQAKQPGPKLCMGSLTMDFKYADVFKGPQPEAYERLLLDCMLGDQTLFIRSDTIDMAWSLLTPVLDAWEQYGGGDNCPCPLYPYKAGSWGPEASDAFMFKNNTSWNCV